MVIVLKVSFSPARGRILLIESVRGTARSPAGPRRGAESRPPPPARRPGSHSRCQRPRGPDKVPIARKWPALSLGAWGHCPAFKAAPLRKRRVRSEAGHPNAQGNAGAPDEVFGSSDWIELSVCSHVVTYCGHRPLSPELSRQSGDTWVRRSPPRPRPTVQPDQ